MIRIDEALAALPHFDKFCSVADLAALAESLRDDPRFTVEVAGLSANGLPIHHVRFGQGSVKALFAGFVHCCEPIGGLTTAGLLTLLRDGCPAVVDVDVEWHVVPCADPDGALLNEGWSQKPFTLETYMKGLHNQEQADQIDGSFPIRYKTLELDRPTPEAAVLRDVIDAVRPDFFYSLHNALAGGAFFFVSHDIGRERCGGFYDLLAKSGIPLQTRIYHSAFCDTFADGVLQMASIRNIYELIASSGAAPEVILRGGAGSFDHVAEINPQAQVLVCELPYLIHPLATSMEDSGTNVRQLKLRIDAENKYVAASVLEEWDKVAGDLDTSSPHYRKILKGMVEARETLHEGLPFFPERTRDLLFNPSHTRTATVGERFENHIIWFFTLANMYEFVRLLKASQQTTLVKAAIARLDPIFEAAVKDIATAIDASRLQPVAHDKLMAAQLGSGFVVLNAMLEG